MSLLHGFAPCTRHAVLLVALAVVAAHGCSSECFCARSGRCKTAEWDAVLDGVTVKDEGSAKDKSTEVILSRCGLTHVPSPCQQHHLQALQHVGTINLTGNPLTCDCHMLWLLHWYHGAVARQLLGTCSLPVSLRDKQLRDLSEMDLQCREVFLVARSDPLSPSGIQLTCGTRGGGEIPPDNAWLQMDGMPLQKVSAVTLASNASSVTTQWQCGATLPARVFSPTVTTSTLAGHSRCVVWGQQNKSASGCVSSTVGGAGGGATTALFRTPSAGGVHHWSASCKGTRRRTKCLPSGEVLINAQRDLKSEGSLCPSLRTGQVFAMGRRKGILGFSDGMSYRYTFQSLRRASVYRLHVHLAPAPGTSAVVPVLVRVNKEIVAEVHVAQNHSTIAVLTRPFKQHPVVVAELELVHLVNVSDFTYERPRVVVMEMYLEELKPPVLPAEGHCKGSQVKQVPCQREVTLTPIRLRRNSTNATIAFQVNGIYLQSSAEAATITIATSEDSQFNFTIKVQHELLRDSEGGSPVQRVILSFSAMDNPTNQLLPVQLQTVLQPASSLLGTLDLRAVFQQSRLFSDSKIKDLNIWNAEVYYRLLDKNGSFVWQPLPSPHLAAAAKPGDDLQQLLDQLPAHTELTLAPGQYHQSLVISKPVSIMSSEGANRTIIYGHVTIKSDNVTLVGLTLHPVNGSAVVTTSHANTAIYNSIIASEEGKIPSDTTKNITGIVCVQCMGLSIRNTLINGMSEGVSLTSSRDVVIVNSVISSCNRGLVIHRSSNGLVCQNLFQNNQLANKQDKRSSVSFQDNRFNRNLQSFNRDVQQKGSTLTGTPSIMDDKLGFPTAPRRLPKPTDFSPFGGQTPTPTSPTPTIPTPTSPMPTIPTPTCPTHTVNTHTLTNHEIGSLQVSMSCAGVAGQELGAMVWKLASRALNNGTCAGVLGSVLLTDGSSVPQTDGILATNAPGPLQLSRSRQVWLRVWTKEKPKWLSYASLSLIRKGRVVASQSADRSLSAGLTKPGTYTVLLHDGLNILDTATVEAVEASCGSSGMRKPVTVQVGRPFKLKCPLCSEKGSLVRYVWYRGGQAVPGQDGRVLQVASAAVQHAGKYHCRVAGQTAYSTVVDVTVQG